MSLSSRVKNKIVDTINTTFASIGHANGMRMPKSDDNREPAAWDLFVSHHVLALATKRKEQAEKAAALAGVIIDKEKDPQPPGTRRMIYNGNVVDVMLEVRNASPRPDPKAMADYLVAKGVKRELVDEAIVATAKPTKPAHVFTTMLAVTND